MTNATIPASLRLSQVKTSPPPAAPSRPPRHPRNVVRTPATAAGGPSVVARPSDALTGRFPIAVETPTPDRWAALAARLRDPDLELDVDTFADVWRAYLFEKRRRPIDPLLVALLLMLQRQVMLTHDDVEGAAVRRVSSDPSARLRCSTSPLSGKGRHDAK